MRSGLRVLINGKSYLGFEEITVTRSIEAAAGSFGARFSTKVPWPFLPGAEVEVLLDGEPVAYGFIDKVTPALSTSGRRFAIEGRDRTGDLVDCAAGTTPNLANGFDVAFGEWFSTRLEVIVAELCRPYGIEVFPWGLVLEPFPIFSLQPGESAWEAIERACRLRGVLAFPDGGGNLILARPATVREQISLEEGINVL
jgi:prophage tail gpP-like protein